MHVCLNMCVGIMTLCMLRNVLRVLCVCCVYIYKELLDVSYSGSEALRQPTISQGAGRIWLTNVQCTGTERQLSNCTASSSGVNSCTHAQDAGVRCQPGKLLLKLMSYSVTGPCLLQAATQEMSGFWEAYPPEKADLRCAETMCGAPCATTCGTMLMPLLYADS